MVGKRSNLNKQLGSCREGLGQDVMNDVTVNICQSEIPALIAISQACVVDSQQV